MIYFIAGFLFLALCFIVPKALKVKQYNDTLEKELEEKCRILNQECEQLLNTITTYDEQTRLMAEKNKHLKEKKEMLEEQIDKIETEYLQDKRQKADLLFEKEVQQQKEQLSKNKESADQEYLNLLKELSAETADKLSELSSLEEALSEARRKQRAITDSLKKEEENLDFYKVTLSVDDIEEIRELKEVGKHLRNVEPLNKVIWKVYYQQKVSELINRVVGTNKVTGIYKITNIKNQKSYVGQAVDIANRFKQHIKRGLGAEVAPRNSKLYPALYKEGIENFTFEILEVCEESKLDELEDYWQQHYDSIEYGYSIK